MALELHIIALPPIENCVVNSYSTVPIHAHHACRTVCLHANHNHLLKNCTAAWARSEQAAAVVCRPTAISKTNTRCTFDEGGQVWVCRRNQRATAAGKFAWRIPILVPRPCTLNRQCIVCCCPATTDSSNSNVPHRCMLTTSYESMRSEGCTLVTFLTNTTRFLSTFGSQMNCHLLNECHYPYSFTFKQAQFTDVFF